MWAAGHRAVGRQTKTKSIRDCGGSPRAGHWPDPNEPRRGCGCEEPDPVCPNWRGAGATVRTDGWSAYSSGNQGYDHQPRSISRGDPAHIVTRVHRVAALLDRWWLGSTMVPSCRYYPTSSLSDSIAGFAGSLAVQHDKGLVGGHAASRNQCEGIRARSGYPAQRHRCRPPIRASRHMSAARCALNVGSAEPPAAARRRIGSAAGPGCGPRPPRPCACPVSVGCGAREPPARAPPTMPPGSCPSHQ